MEQKIITIQNLVKRYPMGEKEFIALKGISLNFDKGEFAGFVGPSGSGKTTILNILGTLDKPTEGTVKVLGKDVDELTKKESALMRKQNIGFIFQSFNLLPVYTVYENVELALLLLNKSATERKQAVMEALQWVGLAELKDKRPPQLSGGESQRVAIARAIVKKPSIVLADEPTANLDAANAHVIMKTMLKLNQQLHTTFIFATHDEKVMAYLNRIIKLADGNVVEDKNINQQIEKQ